MQVTKRNGGTQPLDLNKLHLVVDRVCNGDVNLGLKPIKNTSVSEIEMKANPSFYDGVKTSLINESTLKAAVELISEDTPNYDQVAARLRWLGVRKDVCDSYTVPPVSTFLRDNTERGIYDPDVLNMYSEEEWNTINSFIDHNRDDLFKYAGSEQMYKKYLAQNRKDKTVYETFQIPYILVASILFSKYPEDTRKTYLKRYYDLISQHSISLPTPIMAGLRTRVKQFSSCVLISSGDSLDSISSSATAIVEYASRKAGIGLNIGRIRAQGQSVRNGDAVTTGVLPFAKYFNAALKSCSQGAVRGASATFNYPIWHLEFDTLIELKNNKGTEETRLRTVDYCVHLNKTMYKRLVNQKNITFFSPNEVPDLYEAFYGDPDIFEELYEQYEKDPAKTKKVKPALEVFSKLITERFETGRIYIMNADHVNTHSSFNEYIEMTNLCTEITLPVKPLSTTDMGLIALCTLSALNWGTIDTEEQMAEAAEMAVRGLDELLDYQDYPREEARLHSMAYRPLGIGIIGFAHYLAKNNLQWGKPNTLIAAQEKMEQMAFYLTKASNTLAKEKGPCLMDSKYSQGILPIDTCMNISTDLLPAVSLKMDWESLRADLVKYGIRNSTLMALMPSETSSQLANETNGIEPPRDLITIKGSKDGALPQVVPGYAKLNHSYETAWEVGVEDYLKTTAILQRFIDQAISLNTSYNPSTRKVTTGTLLQDILLAYKLGAKCLYYSNTLDDDPNEDDDGCASGGCKI